MTLTEHIENLLKDPLGHKGFDIVRVQMQESHRKILEIMIERKDRTPVSLADCQVVSREASVLLDVEDPLTGSYVLEVTSPGFDRPLVKPEDFKRFLGSKIKVKTVFAYDGQKRFKGILRDLEDEKVVIEVEVRKNEEDLIKIPLDEIRSAKLVPEFE